MCGICGFFDPSGDFGEHQLELMNNAIIRRGPDGEGYYLAEKVGLAMRRLAIQDIDGGKQPIFNETSTVCIVFNGEIYNFKELKSELESQGHVFYTKSDTEVIVHLYEEYGLNFFSKLRGMYAFAIHDTDNDKLIVARDRFGIKPLFYSVSETGRLVFGSEIKCLLSAGFLQKKVNLQALDAYLTYTYIPAPLTIYDGIYKLEPGHYIVVDSSNISIEKYWDFEFCPEEGYNEKDDRGLESHVVDAVRSHLVSDVEVGAFLSGGIDSSLVASVMQCESETKIPTFTIGFQGENIHIDDERKLAKLITNKFGMRYHEFSVSPNFEEIAEDLICSFDEPFADDSIIPSFYLCKETSKRVKVALSGLGGDELFAGYNRYRGFVLSGLLSVLPKKFIDKVIIPFVSLLPEMKNGGDSVDHIKRFVKYAKLPGAKRYQGYVSSLNETERRALYSDMLSEKIDYVATERLITDHYESCKSNIEMEKVLYTDIKTYLPEDILALSDRLSMWHSLELRVPLIDHKLAEFSGRIPLNRKIKFFKTKIILKEVAGRWLPKKIMAQKKQGFEAPMAGWIRGELRDYVLEILAPEKLKLHGFFDVDSVENIILDHLDGKKKNNKIIFSLMMFQLWFDRQEYLEF
ncbi:asparagine synthase (glutamine-hydrolyzing) [Marinobacter sp.]|uniref:asparagine synthase (glutamine-hydrolyzing) n=1 Tax=Marinobacter sp. TaxID=50741 RepID=UPI002B272646|nr:asparagine synthase (glutamine-hydrolyzing) [Marinobacter sp.]